MLRRVAVLSFVVLSACGPVAPVANCRTTPDCADPLVCMQGLCAMPTPRDAGSTEQPDAGDALVEDAGEQASFDAGLDAGLVVDSGVVDSGVVDSGVVDAGVNDAGVADAGVTDAGTQDSGVCVSSTEQCNGRDDDCDGVIDEQVSFLDVDGGAISFDGGFTAPSGMCVVGLGVCQRSGIASCVSGEVNCSAFVGSGTAEICNRLDDDCDGLVDENDPGLCVRPGELCVSGSCTCPMGRVACGSACVSLGAACSVGVGACLRNGFQVCSAGAVACDVMAGMSSPETCNAIDDDCDGQTDESDPGICSATGQTCVNAMCQCPSGQSVCMGVCKTLTAEVCDGLDNDCNGQTDEGVTIACLADPDDDGYAVAGAATSQQCPSASRASRGFCPTGFVASAQNAGPDCAEGDASKYRIESARTDADGDSYCVGPAANDCIGAGSLPARRAASACQASDDCNDTQASLYRLVSSRADADGDNWCVGVSALDCVGTSELPGRTFGSNCTASPDCNDNDPSRYRLDSTAPDADMDGRCATSGVTECTGVTPPAGKRFAVDCLSTNDCNDANASTWRTMATRADADGDQFCAANSTATTCYGTNLPAGRKDLTTCPATDDCNDASGGVYQLVALRDDADGDTWCVNAAVNTCIGTLPPSGKRLANQCATGGNDCRDSNALANAFCAISAGYKTDLATKVCGFGSPSSENFMLGVAQTCPAGFQYLYGVIGGTATFTQGQTGGTCTVTGPTSLTMSCGALVFGQFQCRIEGQCIAQ
jgi:hypothetical protein